MHPLDKGTLQPVESVSVEVWKQRARKRQNLIKAMATSQHLSEAVPSGSEGGDEDGLSGAARDTFTTATMSAGGRPGRWVGTGSARQRAPPETERPLPFVRDVLAKQVGNGWWNE